jgi:plastocyanin
MRLVLTTAVLVLATACSSSSTKKPAAEGPTPTTGAAGTSLRVAGFNYSPKPLTVAAGATISVSNGDTATHTVTSDTAGLFDVTVDQGSPVTMKAPAKAGTYAFHCSIHPSMHGTLVVTG